MATDPAPPETAAVADALLETLSARDRAVPGAPRVLTLDSSLERDFGFDSLGRVELVLRVERRFGVRLSEHLLATAETPRDVLRAVLAPTAAAALPVSVEAVHAQVGTVEGEPSGATTLVEVLAWHRDRHADRRHLFLLDDQGCRETLTYGELWAGAIRVARGLRARGVGAGQAVAIMLPTSRDYFLTFTGILLAGGIPVPLYPPLRLAQIEDHLRRQTAILNNAQAVLLITVSEAQRVGRLLKAQVGTLHDVLTVEEVSADGEETVPRARGEEIALLQYTSGSTGVPKGVILTHANLLANIRAMGQAVRAHSGDVVVSWLPLYHDMGLIGAWLGSLYYAAPLVVMSPLTFLARPERWLRAIHDYRGTISAGPNFAFELCVRKIDDAALAGLDLSSWRLAVNGAEPISPDTMTASSSGFPNAASAAGRWRRLQPRRILGQLAFRRSAATRSSTGSRREAFAVAGRAEQPPPPTDRAAVRGVGAAAGSSDPVRGRRGTRGGRARGRAGGICRSLDDQRVLPERGRHAGAVPRRVAGLRRLRVHGGGGCLPHRPRQGGHHPRRAQSLPVRAGGSRRRRAGRPQRVRGGVRRHRPGHGHRAARRGGRDAGERSCADRGPPRDDPPPGDGPAPHRA
jgi:acyl carrier protein